MWGTSLTHRFTHTHWDSPCGLFNLSTLLKKGMNMKIHMWSRCGVCLPAVVYWLLICHGFRCHPAPRHMVAPEVCLFSSCLHRGGSTHYNLFEDHKVPMFMLHLSFLMGQKLLYEVVKCQCSFIHCRRYSHVLWFVWSFLICNFTVQNSFLFFLVQCSVLSAGLSQGASGSQHPDLNLPDACFSLFPHEPRAFGDSNTRLVFTSHFSICCLLALWFIYV